MRISGRATVRPKPLRLLEGLLRSDPVVLEYLGADVHSLTKHSDEQVLHADTRMPEIAGALCGEGESPLRSRRVGTFLSGCGSRMARPEHWREQRADLLPVNAKARERRRVTDARRP